MPWNIHYDPETRVVETTYLGHVTPRELRAAVEETMALAIRHKARKLLGNCQQLTGGHSVFDLYEVANELSGKTDIISPLKEAVLLPENAESAQNVEFWENACINRGIDVRTFGARHEAMRWLDS